jgi:tRNA(fMet)-specific endonuclease VapC
MRSRKYLLDTDTFSFVVDGRYPEVRRMVAGKRSEVSISALTLAEAMFGARKKRSHRLESLIEMFREMFPVVPWTEDAARAYADVRTRLEESGKPIGDMDMLIAASAIAGGFVLVTNNVRHFQRIGGLAVENWVKSPSR